MKVIAEIPPTPDEDKQLKEHPYLRPHVFIEEAPIQQADEPSKETDERPDLD